MKENNKHLIVTIHGIGNAQPGETADAVLSGMHGVGPVSQENLWLPELNVALDSNTNQQFKSEIRRVRTSGKNENSETVIAEVNWSDLSAPAESITQTIKNLFSLAIGLGHIALRALSESPVMLRKLSQFISHLIKGPVLSLNCALVLIVFIQAVQFSNNAINDENSITDTVKLALVLSGFLISLVGVIWWLKGKYRIFNGWLFLTGLLLMVATVLMPLYAVQHEATLIDFLLLCYQTKSDDVIHLSGLYVIGAVFLITLQATWVIAWVTTVLMGFVTLFLGSQKKYNTNGLWLGYVSTSLMLWLPTLIIPTVWIAAAELLPEGLIPDFLMKSGVRLMGLQWFFAIIIVLIMLSVFIRRIISKPVSSKQKNQNNAPKIPRLIIAKLVAIFIGLIPFITMSIIVLLYYFCETPFVQWLASALNHGNTIAISSISVSLFTVSFFKKSLATGTDIGLDIAGYFRTNKNGKTILRNKIQHRLKMVLETLKSSEHPGQITLVSHSQGTVFAIKEVAEQTTIAETHKDRFRLITMGSPFTHIYQHYFPSFMSETKLSDDIEWFNYYRGDDFVGTVIDGAQNQHIGLGGHNGYWSDNVVINSILRKQDTDRGQYE